MLVEKLAPRLAAPWRILEIGAGNGLVAEELQRRTGARFTLLDVVDYNRSSLPLLTYGGETLPFDDGEFDLALLVFVLHHNRDPRPLLREALRVAHGGAILVENDVRGLLKRPVTRLIDSIEYVRRGVPPCYFTNSTREWLALLRDLPAEAEVLETFSIGRFWRNVVLHVHR